MVLKFTIYSAPSSSPSTPTLVSKSLTSITINWTYPNISDVDGYVVNVSSLNDYVIQQVNGSSVSQTTLNGLLPGTTYNITVRAYQDILGPASDTILVTTTEIFHTIDWSRTSSITNLLDTQYSIHCITSNIHPTMIYWTVNGLELSNTNYTLVNGSNMTYNSTLLRYPNNELGQSVSVTCSVEGVSNETVTLKAPIVVENITIETVNSTSLKISWTVPVDVVNGFIVHYTPNGTVNVFSNSTYQTVVSNLLPGITYCVSVYAYKDLLSPKVTAKVHIPATTDDPVNSTQNSIVSTSVQQTKSSTTAISSSVRVTPTLMLPSDGDDTFPAAVAGGAAGGGIILILAVVIVVVLLFITLRRRSKDGKKEKDEEQQKIELNVITEEVCTEQANAADVLTGEKLYDTLLESKPQQKESTDYVQLVESPPTPAPTKRNEYESIYATPADVQKDTSFDNKIPTIHPVKKEEFWSYVTERDIKVLQREYRTLYTGEDRRADVGFSPMNKAFNRFRNIIPYDDNRVILQKMEYERCDQDFINASFIDGYSMARKFIATQGPLKSTLVDFMRMIWQEKVQVIVMVTNLWEGGKIKCEQYWPSRDETERTFGPFTVRLRDQSIYPEYTLRTMEIKLGDETRHVIHYQLTSWPDHGVLEYPTPLILVHKRVMNEWHSLGGPLLVHCSAGVGRTGTFITLDMALEQINKEGKVDIAGIVTRLREQRIRMVQTEEQYIFIHDAILEVLTCGDTEITSNTFLSELEELKQITDPQTGETSLQTQFRILSQVTPSPDEIIKDTAEAHPDKNRSEEYLPADKHIVPLQERGRYINASFVGAYSKLHGLIIAQSPMENTAEDFWKMILQYRVSAIVMCCNLIEEGEEVCHQYWPSSEESHVYGRYEVCLSSEAVEEGFIQRSFIVETHDKEAKWSVKQFQITDWLSDGIVRNPAVILQVIECVTKVQQKSGGGPVVVHCSDTVGRSGVFCAASNAIEQCKTEGLVDVFLTVKSIRMKKPGAVYTLEQYTSVYDTVATFLTSNEAYANFL